MNQLIEILDLYFGKKAPQLPSSVKEFIVKIAPYLSMLSILIILFSSSGLIYFSINLGGWGMWTVFAIVSLILYVVAIPGLFKRFSSGWNFIFYAVLIGAIQSLFMMSVVSLIINLIISFYILFQVRPYYFGVEPQSNPPQNTKII